MSYQYTCLYCDNKWVTDYQTNNPTCSKCKDKNLKIKRIEKEKTGNVFGYEEDKSQDDDDDNPINWFSKTIEWGSD